MLADRMYSIVFSIFVSLYDSQATTAPCTKEQRGIQPYGNQIEITTYEIA